MLTLEQKRLIDKLLAYDARVYIIDGQAEDQTYYNFGCKIQDFPRGLTVGGAFRIPTTAAGRLDLEAQSRVRAVHQCSTVQDDTGELYLNTMPLITCTGIFIFMARESGEFINLYAHHAGSGATRRIIDEVPKKMSMLEADPTRCYVLIYHKQMIDDGYFGDIELVIKANIIPAENHCLLFEEKGGFHFFAAMNGYFGSDFAPMAQGKLQRSVSIAAAAAAVVPSSDEQSLQEFIRLLQAYLKSPKKSKVFALRTKLSQVRHILVRQMSLLGKQDELNEAIIEFNALASRYTDWRSERSKLSMLTRVFRCDLNKAKPILVERLLAITQFVLKQLEGKI